VATLPAVEPGLVRHGDRSIPWVALTFDACQTTESEAGYDADIIRILTETQTAATLFLGGLWMQSHPTQTQLLASIPYFELGNHSWSHLDFSGITEEEMASEITKTQEIMYRLTGRQATLFRLPFGTFTDESLKVIARHGLKTIQWDVVTGDPDPNILAEDIVGVANSKTQNGSIIIMHMNRRGWHTAEALPTLIQELSGQGFQFVTVSELLEGSSPDPEPQPLGYGVIKEGPVNVRQEPTTDSELLGMLQAGDQVTVLCSVAGQMVSDYGTDLWFRVKYEDGMAYILSSLIEYDEKMAECE
jgi:peptidoglycan/xylan/chitin deacetylase (PgdA/CDA1 family)